MTKIFSWRFLYSSVKYFECKFFINKYRNIIELGLQNIHYSFYSELLKALHIICGTSTKEYYSIQLLELQTRYCRKFWAKCTPERRIEILIGIRSLFLKYSRRIGNWI